MKSRFVAAGTLAILLLAVTRVAHHSNAAQFDSTKRVTLRGDSASLKRDLACVQACDGRPPPRERRGLHSAAGYHRWPPHLSVLPSGKPRSERPYSRASALFVPGCLVPFLRFLPPRRSQIGRVIRPARCGSPVFLERHDVDRHGQVVQCPEGLWFHPAR